MVITHSLSPFQLINLLIKVRFDIVAVSPMLFAVTLVPESFRTIFKYIEVVVNFIYVSNVLA